MSATLKSIVLASVFISVSAFADAQELSEYPLRVHLVNQEWALQQTKGSGHGDIEQDDSWQGFDYTSECKNLLVSVQGNLTFLGRWKKSGEILLIVIPSVGDTQKECELRTAVRDYIYDIKLNHQLVTYDHEQWAKILSIRNTKDVDPPDLDRSHFPLSVSVLDTQLQSSVLAGVIAVGRGNIQNGSSMVAFEFEAICAAGSIKLYPGILYSGRWVQEPTQMTLLAWNERNFQQCKMGTTVHPTQVYVRNPAGALTALTQEQYKVSADANNQPADAPTPGLSNTSKIQLPSFHDQLQEAIQHPIPERTQTFEGVGIAADVQILTPTEGADFTRYIQQLRTTIKRNWYAVMPESAQLGEKGMVLTTFQINRDGSVPSPDPVLENASGKGQLENAALSAIHASNPFEPLPAEFKGTYIRLRIVFRYNLPPDTPVLIAPAKPESNGAPSVPSRQ